MAQQDPYDNIFEMLYSREKIIKNPFEGKRTFPLGTKRPYYEYRDGIIPERDIVYFTMPTTSPKDSSSFVFIGKAGTQKTRLIKRFVKYYHDYGFKCGIMDPKGGNDWPPVADLPSDLERLHPEEVPCSYDILAGCPGFALRKLSPEERRRFKIINLPSKSFGVREMLVTLGFAPGAAEIMVGLISRGLSMQQIFEEVRDSEDINSGSRANIILHLSNILREEFFSDENIFNLDETWDADKIWAIGYHNQDKRYVCAHIERLMRLVHAREVKLQSMGNKKEKCLLVVDDSGIVCGSDMTPDEFVSVQTCIESLSLWRSLGINMVYAVQSPTMLSREIYNNIKYYFISKCSQVEVLRQHLHNWRIFEKLETIDYRPIQHISEWLCIAENGVDFQSFYPFNCPMEHG